MAVGCQFVRILLLRMGLYDIRNHPRRCDRLDLPRRTNLALSIGIFGVSRLLLLGVYRQAPDAGVAGLRRGRISNDSGSLAPHERVTIALAEQYRCCSPFDYQWHGCIPGLVLYWGLF